MCGVNSLKVYSFGVMLGVFRKIIGVRECISYVCVCVSMCEGVSMFVCGSVSVCQLLNQFVYRIVNWWKNIPQQNFSYEI